MRTPCSPACDHGYRRLYMTMFLPLWFGMITFCTATVLNVGFTGILTALIVTCSMYPAGDLYELIRDRLPKFFGEDGDGLWTVRFIMYMTVVPLLPMAVMFLLHLCGMPGLEYAVSHGFWSAAGSLAILFGFFRVCAMPTSIRVLIGPLQHKPAAE